jgi:dihydrofolate reductase
MESRPEDRRGKEVRCVEHPDRVNWNAELVRGNLEKAVQELKRESGKGPLVGGVKLPMALAEMGLIDEYEFVMNPRIAGHGPTLFAELSKHLDLKLVAGWNSAREPWRCGMWRKDRRLPHPSSDQPRPQP